MATTPKLVGPADPALIKSFANQTPSVVRTSPPTVSTTGTATSTGGTASRSIAPSTSGDTTTYTQATQASSGTELFIVSSNNNDANDIVTVYNTQKEISVSAVNQTINNYKVTTTNNTYGDSNVVTLLNAFGSNTISTTGLITGNGGGLSNVPYANVTGTPTLGNIASTNYDGNASNVLHGDGTWSADQTTYGNSNVVTLLSAFGSNTITTTGNISVGNITATNIGNIANINLTGSNSNVLYGNGVFAPASGGANTGNWEFVDNTMYNMAGGEINNGDPTHGATAGLILPNNGNTGAGTSLFNTYGNIEVQVANLANTANTSVWNFGVDGNLTLPNIANASINYANGDPYGGGANTGNVTFDDINIIGTGNLHLQPDPANASSYLDIFLTSGPDLHLVASAGANLILGEDDGPNVMASWDGNVYVQSWNTGTNTQGGVWKFGEDGNLTLPANTFAVNYANGTQVPLGGSNVTLPLSNGNSNFDIAVANGNATITANGTSTWTFDNTGNLNTAGDIVGPANANFTIYSNASAHEFIFADDGTFYAPDNVVLGGDAIYIGPGANTLTGIEHEVFIASSNHFAYVQGVINNVSDNGSAEWVALGAKGDDSGGWGEIGFTSSGFGDANYTITGAGDGYVFAQAYAPGSLAPAVGGGNLVLATGNQGTTKDIIFGTGGFLSSNIFGRISHANNSLELSRTGATITFPDATEQNTAWTGSVTRISNGNSNVSIPTSSDNVYITTNDGTSKQWIFNKDGSLRTPGNVDIYGAINFPQQVSSLNWSTYNIELSQYGRITTNVDFFANANTIGAQYLKGDGSNISNIAGANISGFVPNANVANTAFAVAAANVSGLGNIATVNLDGNVSNLLTGNGTYVAIPVVPTVGNIATLNLDGSNTNVLYGNGVFAAVAGGANTGNVTFDDVTVQGVNGLNLSAGADFTANLAYLQVRAGDVASHIHLDTGNNQAYDLIVGDDQNYVQVSSTGNILLSAYDSNTSQYTWTLDYNGNLILAGGNSVIQSIANSSLDPTLPNVSTMTLTPDQNYNSQSLVLDPTAPGHIHLRAYAFSNIDEPSANIFLGGEDTAFEITSGANNQAVIHSNGKAWTFGNDGNITSDTLTFTTTFANVKTVEYQTAGVWDLYVEDSITGSNTASSRLNVSFKDNLIDKPQVYIENTKESDGIALRWTFDENGNLNLPGNLVIAGNANVFGTNSSLLQTTDDRPLLALSSGANGAVSSLWVEDIGNVGTSNIAAVYANPTVGSKIVRIAVGQNGGNAGPNLWDFGTDGNLTIPGTSGGFIKTVSNASIGVAAVDNGTNNPAQLLSINAGSGAATSIVSAYATNATIQTNAAGNINTWQFDNTGNLTLPTGGQIIVSGGLVSSGASPAPTINGFSITNSVGISGNGNIAGNNISATGNVSGSNLSTAGTITANGGAYGEVVTTQFASVWGQGAGPNPYSVMQVRSSDGTSGLGMQAFTGSGTLYGNTNINFGLATIRDKDVPSGLVIKAYIDSTGFIANGIVSASGNVTGGNIITGGVVSATGNVSGNFFLGNGSQLTGISATSLVNGTSNVVTTINGNVTIGIAGNAAIATFTGTGANVTGTLNVTGNVTAQGVGTNLVRRANTISGSNTAVTLDNLNAYVGGTPIRLYIGAATSNMTMAGQSQTMSTGALAVSSWINVPIVTGTGNGFAMSGAITNDGDTAVLNVTDQGAGSGTWRVTGMIANTSANLYSVSIERLA